MSENLASRHLLALPNDILFEILAWLPALSITLVCRRICHKMDRLSRELHLWIKVFNQNKHLLPQHLVVDLGGALELEKTICRAEMLERIWTDQDTLKTPPPRSRRYLPSLETSRHGIPVAIMGDYVVFCSTNTYTEQQRHVWVSVHDWNGPPVFQIDTALAFPSVGGYMDLNTGIFFIPFPSDRALEVAGFRVDKRVGQIVEEIRYAFPIRHRNVRYLEPRNGFLCLSYGSPSDSSKTEVDVVDLKKGILFQFSLARLVPPFPQDGVGFHPCPLSTETHLIFVIELVGFAIFERPCNDKGIRELSTGTIPPAQEATCLFPILTGRFPYPLRKLWVMPRSSSSFVVVGITGSFEPGSGTHETTIRAFSFNASDGQLSFQEVFNLRVPDPIVNSVLWCPLSTARYALGVLATNRGTPKGRKCKYFTLCIDLPDPERGSKLENQCKITLKEMQLTSIIDETEVAEFQCFDHFSGRALLFVYSNTMPRADVLLDYLEL